MVLTKKICLLGAYAVGKTSLAQRFVYSLFSEKYHSTLGVKVDRKVLRLDDSEVNLMVWDVAGEDGAFTIPLHYVRGASGCLLVADGTRRDTVDSALDIGRRMHREIGPLPMVLLLNKYDLKDDWQIGTSEIDNPESWPVFLTSAKTGEGVDEAFERMARLTTGTLRG